MLSLSLVLGEMQMKTTKRYYLTALRITKIKTDHTKV